MAVAAIGKVVIPPIFARIAQDVEDMPLGKVKKEILDFDGPVKLDFNREFLDTLSLEKLQHILITARLYQLGKQKERVLA